MTGRDTNSLHRRAVRAGKAAAAGAGLLTAGLVGVIATAHADTTASTSPSTSSTSTPGATPTATPSSSSSSTSSSTGPGGLSAPHQHAATHGASNGS